MNRYRTQGGRVNDFAKVTKLATLLIRYAVLSPTCSHPILFAGWCRIHSAALSKSN